MGRPLGLQARLMAAVIGFVSLILIIVAVITSATLGQALEQLLQGQVHSMASRMTSIVASKAPISELQGEPLTAQAILSEQTTFQGSGLLFAVAPDSGISGVIVTMRGTFDLSDEQLQELTEAVRHSPSASVSLSGVGSFRVAVTQTSTGVHVITGLSRDEIQSTLAQLLTVITLATLGGLILLALTTAITIRVGLRPLRAVALTATRVANQPLDRGEVSITERVPETEADPRTETGLVGASLNKLLDHVDTSLAARQRNEERMRRFVADASHELRTPLASIRGYSELSLRALRQAQGAGGQAHGPEGQAQGPDGQGQGPDGRPDTTESTASALERIQAQSLRMTSLVEDLLLLARLDEGRELVYSSVDLAQVALEGLADARPTAPEHVWNIEVPEEPVPVLGDAGRLHQVVANLLANARTHTPAGTTVTVRVSQEEGDAQLVVHDDGPGIDAGVRDELFARFARGDASRTRQTGGTGLGLAIVKAIVEGHRGRITVTSQPGDTTFTVRIPLHSTESDAASSSTAAPPEAP